MVNSPICLETYWSDLTFEKKYATLLYSDSRLDCNGVQPGYSYPVKKDTHESKTLWIELLKIAKDEIKSEFQAAKTYLKL